MADHTMMSVVGVCMLCANTLCKRSLLRSELHARSAIDYMMTKPTQIPEHNRMIFDALHYFRLTPLETTSGHFFSRFWNISQVCPIDTLKLNKIRNSGLVKLCSYQEYLSSFELNRNSRVFNYVIFRR